MSHFKFGQIDVTLKDFDGQNQVTDILKINVSKVVVFDRVPYSNGKD